MTLWRSAARFKNRPLPCPQIMLDQTAFDHRPPLLILTFAAMAQLIEKLLENARLLEEAGNIDQAEATLRKITSQYPNEPGGWYDLSQLLVRNRRFTEAGDAIQKAIALRPDMPELFTALSSILCVLDRSEEAVHAVLQAITINPRRSESFLFLSYAMRDLNRADDVRRACERAISLDPSSPKAHYSLSMELLRQGEFLRGWAEHQWRWKVSDYPSPMRDFPQPIWDGAPAPQKVLLVHTEQGFGDSIQLARFIPLAARRVDRLVMECHRALMPLMRSVEGVADVYEKAKPLPAFDIHVPTFDLPQIFAATPATIPLQMPYFHPAPGMIAMWADRLTRHGGGIKVGLAWAGNPNHANDRKRSIALKAFDALLALPGIQWVSLQIPQFPEAETRGRLIDWTAELKSFLDTAALIASLDLVVTVDTAIAHLAGAMGKPVFVLIPYISDWRWMIDRTDSPWYPSMRLFRQPGLRQWMKVMKPLENAVMAFRDGIAKPC